MSDKSNSMAYENLNRRLFNGVGEYGIPQIYPETFEGECEFIGFNYARGKVTHEDQKGVHFFLDDYQFDALWRNVDRYIDKLSRFRYVLTPDSYDWCFDGEPEGGTVAISSVGCMNSIGKKRLFLSGYNAMVERLHPESIIFYGSVPEECTGSIVRIKAFHDKFNHALCEV